MALLRTGVQLPLLRTLPATRGVLPLCRPVSTSIACLKPEGYVARNRNLGRPLSPSLKLLASNPEPVWILSFGHRASACVLTPAVSLVTFEYLLSGKTFAEFINSFGVLTSNPALWTTFKFMAALPFTYHCFNGLRHLYWDTGRGFTMKFTKGAGYSVLAAALVSAIGLALYTPGLGSA